MLDTACARVAPGQNSEPAAIETAARSLDWIGAEIAALEREDGGDTAAVRLLRLRASQAALREREICAEIKRMALQDNGAAARRLKQELQALQGDAPLVSLEVDAGVVAAVVSGWTGIPLGKMVKDEIRTVLNLREAVLARCTEVDAGARNVDHILNGSLLPGIAHELLARMADGQSNSRIAVGAGHDGQFAYTIN